MKKDISIKITLEKGDLDFISLDEILSQRMGENDGDVEFEKDNLTIYFFVEFWDDYISGDNLQIYDNDVDDFANIIDDGWRFDDFIQELSDDFKRRNAQSQAIKETEAALSISLVSQGNYM